MSTTGCGCTVADPEIGRVSPALAQPAQLGSPAIQIVGLIPNSVKVARLVFSGLAMTFALGHCKTIVISPIKHDHVEAPIPR